VVFPQALKKRAGKGAGTPRSLWSAVTRHLYGFLRYPETDPKRRQVGALQSGGLTPRVLRTAHGVSRPHAGSMWLRLSIVARPSRPCSSTGGTLAPLCGVSLRLAKKQIESWKLEPRNTGRATTLVHELLTPSAEQCGYDCVHDLTLPDIHKRAANRDTKQSVHSHTYAQKARRCSSGSKAPKTAASRPASHR